MRFSPLLLLPLLVAGQQPLFDQAAGFFQRAKALVGAGPAIPDPIDAAADIVASGIVEKINIRNWQRKLAPKPDVDEEWMIYLTGGNKTCYGKCGGVNDVWNKAVPQLEAMSLKQSSPRLKLGLVNCERDEVLCTAWASGVPVIYHLMVPQQQAGTTEKPKTPLHIVPLNFTDTEISDITAIPSSSKSKYLEFDEYTGIMHPFDGIVAQMGLIQPFGYVMHAIGTVPSWMMMLGISFVSRQIMAKRMARPGGIPEAGGAPPAQPAPGPRVAPASGSQPKAGGGSAKKRK